jgi:hypothetical protein
MPKAKAKVVPVVVVLIDNTNAAINVALLFQL